MPIRTLLTAAHVDEYNELGFLHPIDVLRPDEADWYRSQYDTIATLLGGAPKAVRLTQVHRFYRWAWDLASHPAVLDAVESLLGPDLLVWSAQVFPKGARDKGFITMHQDGTYWGLEGGEVTTAWIALTASTKRNGCMRLLPRSHQWEILPHTDTYAVDNLLTRGQEVQVEYDEGDVTDIELERGQMSLHHVRAVHGSRSNPSDEPRIGFAIRYMTPEVRPVRPGETAALVRGVDRRGHWVLQNDPPAFSSVQSAVNAHQSEAERFVATLTRD